MNRREFIALLAGSVATWGNAADAQQLNQPVRIGILGPGLNSPTTQALYDALLTQLEQFGFSKGKNLTVDYRAVDDAHGPFIMAAELMQLKPDLILAIGPEVALQAVVGASRAIPIVIIAVNYDPIARGYVASLARSGGNITGVVYQQMELAVKQVELLHQAFPERSRLAVMFDAQSADQFSAAKNAASSLNLLVEDLKLENPPYDYDAAFRHTEENAAQMMLILSSPLFTNQRSQIANLAIKHRLPTMFIFRLYVEAGGLMAYGPDQIAMWRRAADYIAKICRGEKPADLPLEEATKFVLTVNLKTAKALGIEFPTAILLRADEVIE